METPNVTQAGMDLQSLLASLTDKQRAPVLERGANVLVEAAPGSGKTRVIVARCASLLASGIPSRQILLLTYSRRAVAELRERLRANLGDVKLPEVRTFHGFASRIMAVEGHAFHNRRLLTTPARVAVFAAATERADFQGFPGGVAKSTRFQRDAQILVAELTRTSIEQRSHLAEAGSTKLGDLISIDEELRSLRDRLGVADYDDLVARASSLARDAASKVFRWLHGRFKHILVDEFQDTDPLQLSLIESMGGEVFAVGDAAQAIYGFRGAARNAIETAAKMLHMKRFELGASFRCSTEVCELAEQTPFLPAHATPSAHENHANDINFVQAATPMDEASLITDQIERALFEDQIPVAKIAVLLRVFAPVGPLVVAELEKRKIPVSHAGGTMLLEDPIIDAILGGLHLLRNPSDAASWAQALGKKVLGFSMLPIRLAFDVAVPTDLASGLTILDQCGARGLVDHQHFRDATLQAYHHWQNDDIRGAAEALIRGWDMLGWLVNSGMSEDAIRASSARLKQFLDGLADLVDVRGKLGLSTRPSPTLDALIATAAQWTDEASDAAPVDAVRVLTIHSAKGLEFDYTIVADAVEGRLPQQLQNPGMLSDADIALARRHGVDLGTTPEEQISEEASLWYVGVTRAKGPLVVTCSANGLDGSPQIPSRFIPRIFAKAFENTKPYRAPFTYRVDDALTSPQEPTRVALHDRLAVTGIDTWLKCKRQFFYSRVLHLGADEMPLQTTMGILVHETLRRFHADVRDFTAVCDDDLPGWIAQLRDLREKLWAERTAELGTSVRAAAAGRTADRLLRAYAESLLRLAQQTPFMVSDVEKSIEFEVSDIAFRGQVDRIDQFSDGSLAIRDYKSGGLDATQQKAVEALAKLAEANAVWVKGPPRPLKTQLALYRHAPNLERVREVSLIYLDGKKQAQKSRFTPVEMDSLSESDSALTTLDALLEQLFFDSWKSEVLELEPTGDARQCMYCDYRRLCPGALDLSL